MTTALLDGNVTDQNGVAVVGALVYVYDGRGESGGLSTLTDVLGQALANPVTSGEGGYWSAYAANNQFYTLAYYWGGRKRYVEANVLLGTTAINTDPSLRTDLAAATGAALVGTTKGNAQSDLDTLAHETPTVLVDAATITPDFSHTNFTLTLGGAHTLANPINAVAGQFFSIEITQDATGSRPLAYDTRWLILGGTTVGGALSTPPGSIDVLSGYVRSDLKLVAGLARDAKNP